ncbi:hypothetical protein CVS40_3503 [Lucilia cuprina]|nr:hypothetical protein CVS40_3503 [Lucilia cuprina]
MHYSKYCNFINHKCSQCNIVGHKEGYCKASGKNSSSQTKFTYKKKNKNHKSKSGSPKSNVVQINKISHASRRKYANVNIKALPFSQNNSGFDVKLQVDTALDISMIGKSLWIRMGTPGKNLIIDM